jgi:hypothetical protein
MGRRVSIVLLAAVVSALCFYVQRRHRPPDEKQLINNFYAHRAAYEELRSMLQEDKDVVRITSWGVQTTKSPVVHAPPQEDFPLNRYEEYLALLKQAGGKWAFRGEGSKVGLVGIGVWASGWGGDTRHVEVCWLDHEPDDQIASLDDFYRTPKPRRPAFWHIDGNWYVWADW